MKIESLRTIVVRLVILSIVALGAIDCRSKDAYRKIDFYRLARTRDMNTAVEDMRQLEGTKISIVGQTYVTPTTGSLITEFTLGPVDSTWFPPEPYYGVRVLLDKKIDSAKLPRYVKVKGVFHIDPPPVGRKVLTVYRIDAAEVNAILLSPSDEIPLPASIVGVAVLALLGGWLCIRSRQRSLRMTRLARRECVKCGYDLRNSSQRCPECGTAF